MANMGDTLTTGQFLRSGDYLVSQNGLFYAILQYDGNFAIFWGNGPTVNACRIWGGSDFNFGRDRFLVMQGDGNLCCYAGLDPTLQGGLLWQSGVAPGPGTYRCTLQNDGNLCVYPASGGAIWCTNTHVEDSAGHFLWSSVANPDAPSQAYLVLAAPDNPGLGSGLIVSIFSSGDPKQIWTKRTWTQNGNEVAFALINQATGLYAYGPWNHDRVRLTDRLDAYALWTRGGDEYPYQPPRYAIRTFATDSWNLNVAGDDPYRPGTAVILWDWNSGPQGPPLNLTWYFQ